MYCSPACIMWIQTFWAIPLWLRNSATSAALMLFPISCANCTTWAMVSSAVTFSRQHFFLRSIISASRQNGFVHTSRNKPFSLRGQCDVSQTTVTIVTMGQIGCRPSLCDAPALPRALCYPASIDACGLTYLRRDGRLVLQRLGRHRLPCADQEVATSRRVH